MRALIGPDPRVIADDVWAKLLWAGLNLEPGDLPGSSARRVLPDRLLVRAGHADLALRRAAQRRDRPAAGRLRALAARGVADPRRRPTTCSPTTPSACSTCRSTRPAPPSPSRSTRSSAQAIAAWEAGPPGQPPLLDRKTGERGPPPVRLPRRSRSRRTYLNQTLIPALCGKAGVPRQRRPRPHHQPPGALDHRQPALQRQGADDAVRAPGVARAPQRRLRPSTTPRSPRPRWPRPTATPATSPATCAPIEVLVDRDAVTSGAAAAGAALAVLRPRATATAPTASSSSARTGWPAPVCDFYTPKDSTKAAAASRPSDNLQRMLAEIPLTDDERAAVDDDRPPSTGSWTDWSTPPPPPAQPPARSVSRRPPPCCRCISIRHPKRADRGLDNPQIPQNDRGDRPRHRSRGVGRHRAVQGHPAAVLRRPGPGPVRPDQPRLG